MECHQWLERIEWAHGPNSGKGQHLQGMAKMVRLVRKFDVQAETAGENPDLVSFIRRPQCQTRSKTLDIERNPVYFSVVIENSQQSVRPGPVVEQQVRNPHRRPFHSVSFLRSEGGWSGMPVQTTLETEDGKETGRQLFGSEPLAFESTTSLGVSLRYRKDKSLRVTQKRYGKVGAN